MQLGVIGLGIMGANLARNAASRSATVAVFNRTTEKMNEFIRKYGKEGEFAPCKTYTELIKTLSAPRAILIMVKAGEAVDVVIEELLPLLSKGDIIIDGGNSHFTDTQRRFEELKKKGMHFIGMGVSGGEEGALKGPSMMPGVDKDAWKVVGPLFEQMAADDGLGGKCVTPIGPGGAGHFVKMVHNGIEYGVMQLIAESYALLQTIGGLSNAELASTFASWNKSEFLQSFLIEITAKIFEKKDDKEKGDLIDMVADRAEQKGTGKWTTVTALDYGVSVPTITAAVDARIISGSTKLREQSKMLPSFPLTQNKPSKSELVHAVQIALELSVLFTYEQGFRLMRTVSDAEKWNINFGEVARIWRGGCIIRSSILKLYQDSYGSAEVSKKAGEKIVEACSSDRQAEVRKVLQWGIAQAIPLPAMSATIAYWDAMTSEHLPQNLIQAQRDFFGAHTYERLDKEGTFHAEW